MEVVFGGLSGSPSVDVKPSRGPLGLSHELDPRTVGTCTTRTCEHTLQRRDTIKILRGRRSFVSLSIALNNNIIANNRE